MTKIAFVGLGDHAVRAHLAHLKTFSDCELAGVFDPDVASIRAAENSQGVNLHRYTTYQDLLADASVQALVISSPDRFHLDQLTAGVQAGKHVFCEKPLCTRDQDVDSLRGALAIAEKKGLVVTSCHPRRFDPPYLWLKENLGALQEKLGAPLSLSLDFSYHAPDPDKRHLHGDSLLQDHANHEIDYVHFLFGMSPTAAFRKLDSYDRYEMSGARDDGLTFEFSGTRRLDQGIYPETIRMRFEHGDLMIDTYEEANSHIRYHEAISHQRGAGQSNSASPITPGVTDYNQRFVGVNRAFINAVQGRGQNYLTAAEMVANTVFSTEAQKTRLLQFNPS